MEGTGVCTPFHLMKLRSSDIFTPDELERLESLRVGSSEDNEKEKFVVTFTINNEKIARSDLKPTEIDHSHSPYLCAQPYDPEDPCDDYDVFKTGKWMVFVKSDRVDDVWEKVKKGIATGHLRFAKVSTNNPQRVSHKFRGNEHVIMIYIKDYTDKKDVIRVLDYLEASEIKPLNTTIKFKTYSQSRDGIYSGGKEMASIYNSDAIREEEDTTWTPSRRTPSGSSDSYYTFRLDKDGNAIDCDLRPTEAVAEFTPWISVEHSENDYKSVNPERLGKWIMMSESKKVNWIWEKIKVAVSIRRIYAAKVQTRNPAKIHKHLILIYTTDYTDIKEVIRVLDYLEEAEIKPRNYVIRYETDAQTRIQTFDGVRQIHKIDPRRRGIYTSDRIREQVTSLVGEKLFHLPKSAPLSAIRVFRVDDKGEETECDSNVNPAELSPTDTEWIKIHQGGKTTKDPAKPGKWIIFVASEKLNEVWEKTKTGVARGDLLNAMVALTKSTINPAGPACHVLKVYTADYTDKDEIIRVLDYLETSGIKSLKETIRYKSDELFKSKHPGGRSKPVVYSSDRIRVDVLSGRLKKPLL